MKQHFALAGAALTIVFAWQTTVTAQAETKAKTKTPSRPAAEATSNLVKYQSSDVVDFGGEEKTFTNTLLMRITANKTEIDFENQMPDSGQILSIVTTAKAPQNGKVAFTFVDGWGNKGKGTVIIKGKTATIDCQSVKTAEGGSNICRNYPSKERLKLARVSAGDRKNFAADFPRK